MKNAFVATSKIRQLVLGRSHSVDKAKITNSHNATVTYTAKTMHVVTSNPVKRQRC